MRKTPILAITLAAATVTAILPHPADAGRRNRGDNAVPDQILKLKAEWAASRRIGGYSDPFTALGKLFRGEDVTDEVTPVINDPRPGTLLKRSY